MWAAPDCTMWTAMPRGPKGRSSQWALAACTHMAYWTTATTCKYDDLPTVCTTSIIDILGVPVLFWAFRDHIWTGGKSAELWTLAYMVCKHPAEQRQGLSVFPWSVFVNVLWCWLSAQLVRGPDWSLLIAATGYAYGGLRTTATLSEAALCC